MAKKHFQRALSVGLSLALCAGMVAPGFAATFGELQDAIDSGNSVLRGESVDESKSDAENYKIKVEAGKDDEGKDTRIVTLYEDVKAEKGESGIVIGSGENVTLDLNGNDIDLNPEWELDLSKNSPSGSETHPGAFVNKETGTVRTDWISTPEVNKGSVIKVEESGSLTLKDSTQETEAPEVDAGEIKGAYNDGAISNIGTTVMKGGKITGNANGTYGGVYNEGTFTMDGGAITENRAGGVFVQKGTFIMNGGEISDNVSINSKTGEVSGGAYGALSTNTDKGKIQINGGVISGNKGVFNEGCPEQRQNLIITGGTFIGNDVGSQRYPNVLNDIGTITLPENKSITIGDATYKYSYINGKFTDWFEGAITCFPDGTKIEKNGTETVYLNGAKTTGLETGSKSTEIKSNGYTVTKTDNGNGTVTITDINGKSHEITDTNGGEVTLDSTGTTTVPADSKIGENTYENGAIIDKDGNVTSTTVSGKNENGNVTVTTKTEKPDGTEENVTTTVTVPEGKEDEVKTNPDSKTELPAGSTVIKTDKDGKTTEETTYLDKATIDKDGKVTTEGGTVTKTDNGDGTTDVTVTDKGGNETEITVPTDKKDDVKVNEDGTIDVPAGGKVKNEDGTETELPFGGKVNPDGTVTPNPDPNAGNQGGGNGVTGGNGEADVIVIDGVEVPLSGLVPVEDVLSVLYRLTEGVDGGRDEVVAWAVENGIIDEEADVEEIVTVAALRAILANYARAFELDVDVSALATLAGEDDDIVMNCDEVIDEFFTKAEEDEAA